MPKRVIFQSDCSNFTLLTRLEPLCPLFSPRSFQTETVTTSCNGLFSAGAFSPSLILLSPVTSHIAAQTAPSQPTEYSREGNTAEQSEKGKGKERRKHRNARDALVERSPGAPSAASPPASVSVRLSLLYYSGKGKRIGFWYVLFFPYSLRYLFPLVALFNSLRTAFPSRPLPFSRMMNPSEQLCDRLAFAGSPSQQFRIENMSWLR